MLKQNSGKLLAIIVLLGLAMAIFLCIEPKEKEASQRPAKVDTSTLNVKQIAIPAEGPVGPSHADRGLISVKPLEPRSKWMSSLSFLIMDMSSGKPLKGAKVQLTGPIGLPDAWSDKDGNVLFSNLPAGIYYTVIIHNVYAVNGSDRLMDYIDLKNQEHKEVLIEMVPSCVASGRIIDAVTEKPLKKAAVFTNRYEDNDPIYTKSNGRFTIPSGELRQADIYINKEGYSPQNIYFGCINGKHDLGDIALNASWILRGKVIDENGDPLSGVEVYDYPKKSGQVLANNVISARSDASGRFSMKGLPTTNEVIFFYKDGYASTDASVNPTTPQDFEIRMFTECEFKGLIEDQDDNPLEGATVMVLASRWQTSNRIVTGKDGSFSIAVQPGYVQLWLIYRNEGGQIRNLVSGSCERDMEPERFTLNVVNETKSSGIVVDSAGELVANAMVIVNATDKGSNFPKRHIMSDEAGKFELAVPERASYKILAMSFERKENGASQSLRGSQTDLVIQLKTFAMSDKIPTSGIVTELDGSQISNYAYCFNVCNYKQRANKDGTWSRQTNSFSDYPPIWIFVDDGRIGKANHIESNSNETPAVTLGSGASLKGKLSTDFATGLTTLELGYHGTKLLRKTVSNTFEFPLLPTGLYYVRLTSAKGKRVDVEHIVIKDGESVDLGEISFPDQN